MGDTGIVRFPGNLDPTAQEFRPTPLTNHINFFSPPQFPSFLPPPPPPLPHQQLYFPYGTLPPPPHHQTMPFWSGIETAAVFHHYPTAPPPLPPPPAAVVQPLPPPSAAPTRTVVLSSVPCDVSESVVRSELEVFGEVRGVQMERMCDGIVTVHFYDLRHAEMALREVREQHMQQQSRLRSLVAINLGDALFAPPQPPARGLISGCAVWAHFIIPSCNSVPDGHNQGTIVVFNLDPNISTSSLKEIFEAFGAVKELRETPLKKQQRFVEFYDVRDAAKALREMNGKDIYGNPVVIEFSRPGGYGRKFFNAGGGAAVKTSSTNNFTITNSTNVKISRYVAPPQQPQSPRPFSRRLSRGQSPQAFLASNQCSSAATKKSLNSGKGSPNASSNGKCSIEASVECLSLSTSCEDGTSEKPQKRNNAKKVISISSHNAAKHQQKNGRAMRGKQANKFDTRFLINEDAVVESNCSDSRTTVMIKNIPNKYSQKLLLSMLDNHCIHCNEQISVDGGGDDHQPLSSYDFVYLPIDFNNKCNVGYGFVNMTSPQAAWRLYKAFHHQHWEVFNSRKICEVTYARVQGLEALKEHFKNSKFPCEMEHYLPVVFSPPRDGRHLTDPLPVVAHKQQTIILGLPTKPNDHDHDHETDGRDFLDNVNVDQEQEQENMTSSCYGGGGGSQNGGDVGYDDDRDSSSCCSYSMGGVS